MLGRAYAEITQHYPSPGWVEHDAEEIWQKSRRVAAEALAASGCRRRGRPRHRHHQPARDDGPLGPQDGGPRLPRDRLAEPADRRHLRAPQGRGPRARLPRAHRPRPRPVLLRQQDRVAPRGNPALRARAEAGEIAFGTIDSWLIHRLTGGRVHATDPTNASRTLLFDIHSRRWDPELLRILGVPAAMLPEVRPSCGVFGETVALDGIPAGVPIAGDAGDQQAALFGQGCFEPGMAKNTYGTGAFLVLNTGDRRVISRRGLLTTLCCDARGRRRLRPRGLGLHRRRRGAVAARRDGPRAHRGRDGAHRGERAGHPRRLRRARLHRPRRALLGRGRPRRDRGPHPRRRARPPRARDAREPRLPEPRRDRRDERGVRGAAARAAGGRRRLRPTTS